MNKRKFKSEILTKQRYLLVRKEIVLLHLIELMFKREERNKNPKPSVSDDIWGLCKEKDILKIRKSFMFTPYQFKKNLTHREVLAEAKRTSVYKGYTWQKALLVLMTAIIAGKVDEEMDSAIVYFDINDSDGKMVRNYFLVERKDNQLIFTSDNILSINALSFRCKVCFGSRFHNPIIRAIAKTIKKIRS